MYSFKLLLSTQVPGTKDTLKLNLPLGVDRWHMLEETSFKGWAADSQAYGRRSKQSKQLNHVCAVCVCQVVGGGRGQKSVTAA